ncbi:hypothetical protein [Streptomyces sp. AC627_RSS907]|uniref:hypothetical protein n=1 Tax=Streptomyces sp. AC627_RSS907 TaxID=2823684 RepID=UPI001C230AAB|nr:hypothetical protein [Streptomyces sp. AC627_RSS907]
MVRTSLSRGAGKSSYIWILSANAPDGHLNGRRSLIAATALRNVMCGTLRVIARGGCRRIVAAQRLITEQIGAKGLATAHSAHLTVH